MWYVLRDRGYYKARVEEPKFSFIPQASEKKVANVTVHVDPGIQYRVGEIHFEGTTVFTPDQLQNVFPVQKGELFKLTKVLKGLEDLRKLYATKGYVNFFCIPQISTDESLRTADMTVKVEEGRPYNFGRLYLEGVEPHPGAGKALQNSWKPLEGKRYNSLELQRWLRTNHTNWKVSTSLSDATRLVFDNPESQVVNVKLTQWPN
jgi:outer membrane translocation and assembly module TamA